MHTGGTGPFMYPLKTIVKTFGNKNSTKNNLRESSLTFSHPQVSPPPQNNLQKNLEDFPLQSMLKKPASVLHTNWSVFTFFESAFFFLAMMRRSSKRMTNISVGLPESRSSRGPSIRIWRRGDTIRRSQGWRDKADFKNSG